MTTPPPFEDTEAFARKLDAEDPLRAFRDEFLFPKAPDGRPVVYLAGNSLGLQPRNAARYIQEELERRALADRAVQDVMDRALVADQRAMEEITADGAEAVRST